MAISAVGLLRALIVAKQLDKELLERLNLKPWGSFDGWSNLVRAAVVWCELPDPGDTRQELASVADRSAQEIKMLIGGWEEADPTGQGITVSHALELLAKKVGEQEADDYPTLRAAINEITPFGQRPSARSIGMKLHRLKGRVCGGKAFDRDDSGKVV